MLVCFVTRCRLPVLRPPGNKRRCSYQRASLCLTIRCVSVYGGGYWRMHLPTCLCVMLTDCGPTCILNPFFLQNLFHVTDVFLPPDYVTNLQKVTEPLTDTHSVPCPILLLPPSLPRLQQSMRHTPVSRAFGSPQRQSSSRPPRTPSSGASNSTPGEQGKRAGKRPKSAKVEQDQPLPSSQEESPLSRYVSEVMS